MYVTFHGSGPNPNPTHAGPTQYHFITAALIRGIAVTANVFCNPIVVSVMDSHSCDRGSSPGQGKHIYVML